MVIAMAQGREKLPRVLTTVAVVLVSAAPFLALQVVQNRSITGRWLETPYRLYADLYTPQMSFGFHRFDPTIRPKTTLQQRVDYYDQFTVPAAMRHRPDTIVQTWLHERLPALAKVTTPNRLLLILAPFGLIALRRYRPAAVPVGVPLVWVALYAAFAYLLDWYCIVVAPAVIACVVLGTTLLPPRSRLLLTLVVAGIAVAALPEFDRRVIDDDFHVPVMTANYLVLPHEVRTPAIVLFHYETGDSIHAEPVYNFDVVNPDDAPIIRAHDLGEQRNRELFDYYARRQPQRMVYRFDRGEQPLTELGTAAALARKFPLTSAPPRPPPEISPATSAPASAPASSRP
jgi:hypothetical protein